MGVYVEYDKDGNELRVWTEEEAEEAQIELGSTDEGTLIIFEVF